MTVPAGYRGVVTLLAGREPKDPNVILVGEGERGVQKRTLEPGMYYLNPYETRVSLVDCRSKRFNLGTDGGEMDFLSADGFAVTLDGAVEFRVIPDRAAEVFVLYNEDANGDEIDEEIIAKIITPESRSLCRVGGSKLTGGQFISGDDREQFQRNMVKSLTENCQKQGIEILAVAITSIQPPQEIATPVRAREVAKQELAQYNQEKIQQLSEAQLKVQVLLAEQKKRLVEGEQTVVEQTTKAEQDQSVAVTLAEQKLKVAETQLEAAKDKAAAMIAKAEAEADVIRYNNKAELAGLATRVQAFDGDGTALAQNLLIGKLAPAFRTILANSDGPLMELFGQFARLSEPRKAAEQPPRRRADRRTGTEAGRLGVRVGPHPRVRPCPDHLRGGPTVNPRLIRPIAAGLTAVLLLYVVGYLGIWQWNFCRIEVPPNHSLLLRYKGPFPFGSVPQAPDGTLVQVNPSGRPKQVGILETMPGPGRHFYSPLEYETTLVKDILIEPGSIGVVTSKVGKSLPAGTYPGRLRGLSGHLEAGPDARPLPDELVCLRGQGPRRRRVRRAGHGRGAAAR